MSDWTIKDKITEIHNALYNLDEEIRQIKSCTYYDEFRENFADISPSTVRENFANIILRFDEVKDLLDSTGSNVLHSK